MAVQKNLEGLKFGQLSVIEKIGDTTYGGRRQALWRCVCACDNVIELPTDKLPHSAGSIAAARRTGRAPYTSCEDCRQKVCIICGARFPHSHPSHICPKEECQEEQRRRRDEFWHQNAVERYRTDPEYREKARQYWNLHYAKNAPHVQELRRKKISELTPVELAERRTRIAAGRARYYLDVRTDPGRYAARMEGIRQRRAARELERFLSDAQELLNKMDK